MIVEDGTVKSINVEHSILDHAVTSAEALLAKA
jgi:peroxiredoxin